MVGEKRRRRAIVVLWVGAFLPFIFQVAKTVEDVGGVGPLELIRGGGPVLAFVLSYLIAPQPTRKLRFGLVELGLTLFLLVATFSTVWSVDPRSTLLKAIPLVFAYLCLHRLVSMYDSGIEAIRGLATVIHVILLGAALQFVVVPGLTYSSDDMSAEARFHTTIPAIASNLFGVVAAVGMLAILLRLGPAWTSRLPAAPVLFIAYAAMLVATRSRIITAVALVLIAIAYVAVMRRSKLGAAAGWFGIAGGIAAVWWAVNNSTILRSIEEFLLRGQDAGGIATLTGRTVIWDRALAIRDDHAPFGGFGYYAGHRLGLSQFDPIFLRYSNLDSTWIESLVNVGILGTVGLAIFALFGLLRLRRLPKSPEKALAVLAAGGVIAMSFFNPGIQTPTASLVIFAVCALASGSPVATTEPKRVSSRRLVGASQRR